MLPADPRCPPRRPGPSSLPLCSSYPQCSMALLSCRHGTGRDRTDWDGTGWGGCARFEGDGAATPRSSGADKETCSALASWPVRACCRLKPFVTQALPSLPPAPSGWPGGRSVISQEPAPTEGRWLPLPPSRESTSCAAVPIPGVTPTTPESKASPHRCIPSRFPPRSVNQIPFGICRRKISRFPKRGREGRRVSHNPLGIYPSSACAGSCPSAGACGNVELWTQRLGCGSAPRSSRPSRACKSWLRRRGRGKQGWGRG